MSLAYRSAFALTFAIMLASCASNEPPKNVTSAYDGKYTGKSTTDTGGCSTYDVMLNVEDGQISGRSSGSGESVDMSGYVTEGGQVSGRFTTSTGQAAGQYEGKINKNGQFRGTWNVSLGANCSGSIKLRKSN
jgi:hypothetical protein